MPDQTQSTSSQPESALWEQVSVIGRWAGPVVIVVAAAIMLWWTWETWPDPLVDFGQQLYIAWQLAEGKVLYRDVAYHHGPLSPYTNALWFKLFGVGLRTLAICNVVILAGLICVLYRLLLAISDWLAATIACLVLVTIFAFGQLCGAGNYNFVCPYVHGLTHGLTLSVLAIYVLSMYRPRRGWLPIAGGGFLLGLVFLTKAEVFVAAALATIMWLALTLGAERARPTRIVAMVGVFAGAALAPPLIAFVLFSSAMPAGQALMAVLGPWPSVLGTEAGELKFYREGMGTLDTADSIRQLLTWTGWYALVFVPAAGLAMALCKPGLQRIDFAVVAAVVIAILLAWVDVFWLDAARPLPAAMIIMGAVCLVMFVKGRNDPDLAGRWTLRLTMTIFALGLLLKMILNTRVYHYGFALAMPATLLLVAALVSWIPAWLTRVGGYGAVFRAVGIAVLAIAVYGHLKDVDFWFGKKEYTVASGADRFRAHPLGQAVNLTLKQIEQRVGPDETITVLPDGAILNYLSRRVNPTPYNYFMPTDLIIYGEDRMLASFQEHPPDYIILVHKDTSEFGYRFFGRDYGQRLFSWIQANYRTAKLIGKKPPLQSDMFGIMIMQRVKGSSRTSLRLLGPGGARS